jgi:mRNA interferase MazF
MGSFAAGQVVLVDFPFSDLTASKLRPAIVLADAGRGDWILCQVTSSPYGDRRAISLSNADVLGGSLHRSSYVRPGKLFTAHSKLISRAIGSLADATFINLRDTVVQLIQSGGP